MEILGAEYTWSKTYGTEPEEQGKCYLVTDNSPNHDFSFCTTNIFSAAVAVWEELSEIEYDDLSDDIIKDIVKAFQDERAYTFPYDTRRTYFIEPMNLWRVKKI